MASCLRCGFSQPEITSIESHDSRGLRIGYHALGFSSEICGDDRTAEGPRWSARQEISGEGDMQPDEQETRTTSKALKRQALPPFGGIRSLEPSWISMRGFVIRQPLP